MGRIKDSSYNRLPSGRFVLNCFGGNVEVHPQTLLNALKGLLIRDARLCGNDI